MLDAFAIPCILLALFIRRSKESACLVYMAKPADDATTPAMINIAIVLSFSSGGEPLVVMFGDAMVSVHCMFRQKLRRDSRSSFCFLNSQFCVTLVDTIRWYEMYFVAGDLIFLSTRYIKYSDTSPMTRCKIDGRLLGIDWDADRLIVSLLMLRS